MKVLVLGARGMLGCDLLVAAEGVGHEVAGFGRTELDVTDFEALRRRFDRETPDAVINCAAWTDVDGAEDNPDGAMAVNGGGAANAAAAAAEVGARVMYISTDYVFDGKKGRDYVESDQVGPINVYGQTKVAGEQATVAANRRSWVVRSSWLFGVNGRNFVDTMLRLGATQGEVSVVRDQIGSPTWTWHLAHGLVGLLDSDAYGLHHMAAAGRCSWYDFAREIFDRSGLKVTMLSVSTDALGRKAPRPTWSALASQYRDRIELPDWQDGLGEYLARREVTSSGSSK